MTWIGLLSRAWRRPKPAPMAQEAAEVPGGVDSLFAQSGRAGLWAPSLADRQDAAEPDAMATLLQSADRAQAQENWAEAARLWAAMRTEYPTVFFSYTGGARALWELGEPEEAWPLLADAVRRFPWEHAVRWEWGRLAMKQMDWWAAETQWRAALTFDVRPWWLYTELARSLEQQGRLADSEAMLLRGQANHPEEVALFFGHAEMATRQGDMDEAGRRWSLAVEQFPTRIEGYAGQVAVMRQLGRLADIEPVLQSAAIRFPDDPWVWTNFAQLAEGREDWAAAVVHWSEFRRRFTHGEEASARLHHALLRLAETDPGTAAAAVPSAGEGNGPADANLELGLSFESLGGTYPGGGCEFGFFQRACGAEPLGLLRWAFVSPESLFTCLGNRFEGIGHADNTDLYTEDDEPNPCWDVRDRRTGIALHSFVPASEVSRERMAVLTQKRMRFLRDKLLADLAEAGKIFVYKSADRPLGQVELEKLGRLMRSYGSGEVLCVFPYDADHPPGAVERHAANIMIGYLDFADEGDTRVRNPDWLALCQTVLKVVSVRPGARTPL